MRKLFFKYVRKNHEVTITNKNFCSSKCNSKKDSCPVKIFFGNCLLDIITLFSTEKK